MTQIQLSQHGFLTKEIFNLHIRGGLKEPDRVQKIKGVLYEATKDLTPKIVLEFGIASESRDSFIEKPSSLRFDNFHQLEAFIFHLQRGSMILGSKVVI